MSRKSFKGIAYWSVSTTDAQWAPKAVKTLLPLESAGLAMIGYDCTAAGDHISVGLADERHELLINGGKGQGVVRLSATAAQFVVCLMVLRRSLGHIELVDDAQQPIPALPRQSYELFGQ